MSSPNLLHRLRWWLMLPLSAALLALLPWLHGCQQRWLALRAAEELASLPDNLSRDHLRRAAQLGDAGTAVLVQALCSPRDPVALAARDVLLEELSRWELLSHQNSALRVASLAQELSLHQNEFGPTARQAAGDVARRILAWPQFQRFPTALLLADQCERILRTSHDDARLLSTNGADDHRDGSRASGVVYTSSFQDPNARREIVPASMMHIADLPGGALPVSIAHETMPASEPSTSAPGAFDPPGLLPRDMSHARPLAGPEAPPSLSHSVSSSANAPATLAPPDAALPGLHNTAAQHDTFELVAALHSRQPHESQHAEAELVRRGFTAVHLQLARRLSDPDPAQRARWAAALPGMADVDARPWLLWLSRDADAEVRRIALTLMATTGDPALVRRAVEVARADSDPRIQRLSEQLASARR